MNGSDFVNPLSSGSKPESVRASYPSAQTRDEKKARVSQLKSQVAAGKYAIDFQKLSQKVYESGALKHD